MEKKWKYNGLLILEGKKFDIIAAVNDNGNCPFWDEFFLPLTESINNGSAEPTDKAAFEKLRYYFEKFADQGSWANEEQLRRLNGTDFFEFKVKQIHRVFFYYDSENKSVIILTHHITKKTDKTPAKEKERIKEIQDSFKRWRKKHE
jgi:phage-related protein